MAAVEVGGQRRWAAWRGRHGRAVRSTQRSQSTIARALRPLCRSYGVVGVSSWGPRWRERWWEGSGVGLRGEAGMGGRCGRHRGRRARLLVLCGPYAGRTGSWACLRGVRGGGRGGGRGEGAGKGVAASGQGRDVVRRPVARARNHARPDGPDRPARANGPGTCHVASPLGASSRATAIHPTTTTTTTRPAGCGRCAGIGTRLGAPVWQGQRVPRRCCSVCQCEQPAWAPPPPSHSSPPPSPSFLPRLLLRVLDTTQTRPRCCTTGAGAAEHEKSCSATAVSSAPPAQARPATEPLAVALLPPPPPPPCPQHQANMPTMLYDRRRGRRAREIVLCDLCVACTARLRRPRNPAQRCWPPSSTMHNPRAVTPREHPHDPVQPA